MPRLPGKHDLPGIGVPYLPLEPGWSLAMILSRPDGVYDTM
jgi:hypothetical protein